MYSCWFRCYLSRNPQWFGFLSAESTAPNAQIICIAVGSDATSQEILNGSDFFSAESTAPNAQIICIAVSSDATSREILNGLDSLFTPEVESTALNVQIYINYVTKFCLCQNRTPADKFYRSSMNKEICFIMMLYKFLLQLL